MITSAFRIGRLISLAAGLIIALTLVSVALKSLWFNRITGFAISQRVQAMSPDGGYTAERYAIMDSAAYDSSTSTVVEVWPNGKNRFWNAEVVFRGLCLKRLQKDGTEEAELTVEWTSSRSLRISCPSFAGVSRKMPSVDGVQVDYRE